MLAKSFRNLAFLFILFAPVGTVYAQPTDARGTRGNDGKTYGERDIERTADNTAKANIALKQWVFDQNAIDNLIEQWKRNSTNYISPQQKAAIEQAAKAEALAQKKRQAIIYELDQDIRTYGRPYKEILHRSGFVSTSMELNNIIEKIVFGKDSYDKSQTETFVKLIQKFALSKQAFEAGKETATAEVLLAHIASYLPAWETSLIDLNFLLKRFPDKLAQIDTLRIFTVGYCLGMTYAGTSYRGYESSPTKNYLQDYMAVTVFEPLADKYPELALQIAAQTTVDGADHERNPYYLLADYYNTWKGKENYPKQIKYVKLALLTPYKNRKGLRNDGRLTKFEGDEKFYQSISIKEWKEMMKAQNRTVSDLFGTLFNSGSDASLLLVPRYYAGYNKGSNKKYNKNYGEAVILNALSAEGDADALNLLGVYTIWGKIKGDEKKGVEMLRAAAAKGSVLARFNLIFATLYKIKGSDYATEVQAFINFFSGATMPEVQEAINLVNRLHYSNGWERDLGNQINAEMRASLNQRSKQLYGQ